MQLFLQDFRYALRMLRKNVGLTIVVVLSLAIGIGANSAIFSVVDALLLRPLPYPQPERLANIWLHSPGIGIFRDWPSPGQYIDIQNENHSFEEMAIARLRGFTLTGRDQPERIDGMYDFLHAASHARSQAAGRTLAASRRRQARQTAGRHSQLPALAAVVQLRSADRGQEHHAQREAIRRGWGAASGVLDQLRKRCPPKDPWTRWMCFCRCRSGADAAQRRGDENYNIMVRLKPGVSVQQAQADIDVIAGRIREKDKRDRTFGMTVIGLQEQVVGDVRRALLVLLGSVALVLLIACANVANLLLTRAAGREKEIAIRTALGAGGLRIVRQLLTESVLLAMIGGAAGLVIAQWALYVVRTINPGNIPQAGGHRKSTAPFWPSRSESRW